MTECARLADDLLVLVDAMVEAAHAADGHADRHVRLVGALTQLYVARAKARGVADAGRRVADVLGGDIEINAQGLEVWLDRLAKARAG